MMISNESLLNEHVESHEDERRVCARDGRLVAFQLSAQASHKTEETKD